jgi:hypothetical protein
MDNHLAEALEERNDRWIPPCLRPRYAAMREQAVLIRQAREIIAALHAARERERASVSLPDKNVAARD